MLVLWLLSRILILFGVRYFVRNWQKISAHGYLHLWQNEIPAHFYLYNLEVSYSILEPFTTTLQKVRRKYMADKKLYYDKIYGLVMQCRKSGLSVNSRTYVPWQIRMVTFLTILFVSSFNRLSDMFRQCFWPWQQGFQKICVCIFLMLLNLYKQIFKIIIRFQIIRFGCFCNTTDDCWTRCTVNCINHFPILLSDTKSTDCPFTGIIIY